MATFKGALVIISNVILEQSAVAHAATPELQSISEHSEQVTYPISVFDKKIEASQPQSTPK